MSISLTFEDNHDIRWIQNYGAYWRAECPLCHSKFVSAFRFIRGTNFNLMCDGFRDAFETHMLTHARRGEPHELTGEP